MWRFPIKAAARRNLFGWGFQAANHPAEQVQYSGRGHWGRSLCRVRSSAPPLPRCSPAMAALRRQPSGLLFDGSKELVHGLVMIPYEDLTFHGSGANTFNGECFAAQMLFSGSGLIVTSDTPSAVKGDPGLI
jgi:hypothetical protein